MSLNRMARLRHRAIGSLKFEYKKRYAYREAKLRRKGTKAKSIAQALDVRWAEMAREEGDQ